MKKIPTLFKRDPEAMRRVLPEVTPGCEWVLAGEGVATRKYDGTCMMLDGEGWWARREVKQGRVPPPDYLAIETDENTGKTVGWEPIAQSPFAKFHADALETGPFTDAVFAEGTYELCGPKINGNLQGLANHVLVRHARAQRLEVDGLTFEELRTTLTKLAGFHVEGIVWHHPDGRMAKLKVRDFPRERP